MNVNKKYFYGFCCLFMGMALSSFAWGAGISLITDPQIYVSSSTIGSSIAVNFERPGDGKSESSALKVYIPVTTTASGGTTSPQYNSYWGNALRTDVLADALLPHIVHGIPYADNVVVTISSLYHSDTANKKIYIATKLANTSSYKVISWRDGSVYNTADPNEERSLAFGLDKMCTSTACDSSINPSSDGADLNVTQYLYIFTLSDDASLSEGTTFNPTTDTNYQNGYYLNVMISSRVPTTTIAPTIVNVTKGDTQLTLEYDARSITDNGEGFYKLVVIRYPKNSAIQVPQHLREAIADSIENDRGIFQEDFSISSTLGTVRVSNLVNGQEYNISVGLVNKFNFITMLSKSVISAPLEIEAFLKEKSCYIISAGFQHDHYVLEYFRHFRDTVLLHHAWGNTFVNWYYETAPHYAHYVYKSSTLSFIVRTISYMLYFLMKFFMPIMRGLFVVGLFLYFVFRGERRYVRPQ